MRRPRSSGSSSWARSSRIFSRAGSVMVRTMRPTLPAPNCLSDVVGGDVCRRGSADNLAGVDRFGRFLKFLARSTKRVAVLIVGSVVVAAGLAMLVLPGPGLLVIILGLAILATEFAWAEYLLHKAKEKAVKAKDRAQERINRR